MGKDMQAAYYEGSSSSAWPELHGTAWVSSVPLRSTSSGLLLLEGSSQCLHNDCHLLVCRLPLESIFVTTSLTPSGSRLAFEWMMKHMHGASRVALWLLYQPYQCFLSYRS